MPKYIIERNVPGAGSMPADQICEVSKGSNEALASLNGRVHWQQSYFTADKVYCVYIADSEDSVREHARLAGVPADIINRVTTVVDPSTGEG